MSKYFFKLSDTNYIEYDGLPSQKTKLNIEDEGIINAYVTSVKRKDNKMFYILIPEDLLEEQKDEWI